MRLTEHTGHGVPTIVSRYGKNVFEIEDNYIRYTIPFDQEVLEKSQKNVGLNVGLNVRFNKTERAVVPLLISNPTMKVEELAEQIGVSKRTVERALSALQEKEVLIRIGSKRDGMWKVIIQLPQ
ncbi:HTH domain-containing protein [Anaerolactibacter massiliensis]|uniref:HTH domain-containing protein n=1 Tax=Anaerolactibacter massiliensis TaxID=2044573 RepID=UPI000CF857D1|nr:HTH domain-containing protein [Anaerolactibacter massiliensis]MDD7680289.1 HTH domain-containing protein [Stecheria intestinalis]